MWNTKLSNFYDSRSFLQRGDWYLRAACVLLSKLLSREGGEVEERFREGGGGGDRKGWDLGGGEGTPHTHN